MLRYAIRIGILSVVAIALGCGDANEGRTAAEKAPVDSTNLTSKQQGGVGPKPKFTNSQLEDAGKAQDAAGK